MKALFIPFAPSLAHVSRCLAVAQAWRAQGHTATFALGTERIDIVQNAGFDAYVLPEVSSKIFRQDRGFRWLTNDYFTQNLRQEQRVLASVRPDVVVYDFRFTAALSARVAGLPSVSIVHGNALRMALRPYETAQLLVGNSKGLQGMAALRLRVMRRLFPLVFQLLLRVVARQFAPSLKTQDWPPVNSPFALLLGDEILVASIPDLLPPELPSNCHVVGPLMWSGWAQTAPWLDELDTRPLIYVTMGSTIEAQPVLVKIIDALRDAPYDIVISTGDLSLPTNIGLPSHIRIFSVVPGATVVRRSAAVIHHGGHETLMQVLAAGVPSLIVPANPDQILVAQQAQALGVGHSLWRPNGLPLGVRSLDGMTATEIRRAVDDLLDDQDCVRACKTLKEEIAGYCGAKTAADILEGVVL